MDSLRQRDYTFPHALPSDSLPISGGGENFYKFLKTELLPHIHASYRTDTSNQTMMGHSFGGYFVLYALLRDLQENIPFNYYVAASPSLPYYDFYLKKQFESLSLQNAGKAIPQLYLTTGEMEIAQDTLHSFSQFRHMLSEKDFIRLKTKIYAGLEHMGTAVPSFEEGVELILKNE
jgi:predicted alpha/beta superfamily hydrolase